MASLKFNNNKNDKKESFKYVADIRVSGNDLEQVGVIMKSLGGRQPKAAIDFVNTNSTQTRLFYSLAQVSFVDTTSSLPHLSPLAGRRARVCWTLRKNSD